MIDETTSALSPDQATLVAVREDGAAAIAATTQAAQHPVPTPDPSTMPITEDALKETLRLHPPLILLLRVAKEDFEVGGSAVRAGQMVGASPWVSNRIGESFADPDRFDLDRYVEPRAEDLENPWNWIPFGAGRHRCVGAAFAMMQLKAIFAVLLRDWELELAQPPDSYRPDMSKMVIQLQQPVRVRYRRRVRNA